MAIKRRPFFLAFGLGVLLISLLFFACGGEGRDFLGRIVTPTPTPGPVNTPAPLDLGQRDQGPFPEVVEGLDAAYATQVLDLTNEARQANGLFPLTPDASLEQAAASYAQVLAVNDWFDHVGPDGSTVQGRAEAAGYAGWVLLAENLAKGTGLATPAEVVDAWMASEGHRHNILNPGLEEIGVACYFRAGPPPRFWCVQEFGTQRLPTPTPTPTPSPTPTATSTPTPSPTPTSTPSPTPTGPTPSPTPTPTPSPTPTATPTPTPTATATPGP